MSLFLSRTRHITQRCRIASPFLVLGLIPVFALSMWAVTSSSSPVAIAVPIASLVFYACYAVCLERWAEARISGHLERFNAEVETRLKHLTQIEATPLQSQFDVRLAQEIKRAQRYELPLSIIVMRLQPSHGTADKGWHAATSMVLNTAADEMRSEDIVGYLGGYEYAFCLPHTNRAGSEVVLKRLQQRFALLNPCLGNAYMGWEEEVSAAAMIARARDNGLRRQVTPEANELWNELVTAN